MHEARGTVTADVEARMAMLSEWNQHIWQLAEPAWREYGSSAWYVQRLRDEGFDVEAGSGGMPTAFQARFGQGSPTIATYVEYDAVPGNSQAAVSHQAPRPGTTRHAAGHTDPHSALGIGALGGALAAKEAMRRHRLAGTLVVFGEPAEKVQGSKPIHAAKGYYDDLDATVSFHPSYMEPYTNTTRWDTHCGAYGSRVYTFTPDAPEQWSTASASPIPAAHADVRAPGAIDAVCLMYSISKQLREHTLAHTGSWSINEAILAAGQATADNLPPDIAQIQYAWRVPTLAMAERVAESLDRNANHVASLTGCRVEQRWVSRTRPGLANHALAAATYANLELVGAPTWSEEAREFARAVDHTLGYPHRADPLAASMSQLRPPREAEQLVRRLLPSWQTHFTSDDYVEYTWHCPTVRLYIGRCALAPSQAHGSVPAWVANALGGLPACIDPTIRTASAAIGLTLVDLLTQPALRRRATAEFRRRTGGGIGGADWIAPLLPADFEPAVDLRWPEYITTERGSGWWIP